MHAQDRLVFNVNSEWQHLKNDTHNQANSYRHHHTDIAKSF